MKIKKCRKIVDEIFEELDDRGMLDTSDLLYADAVRRAKEACAKIIKARLEGGE